MSIKRKIGQIDFVPTKWLAVNNKKILPFLEAPIKEEDAFLLETIVKTQMHAPPDWTLYRVKIIGIAQNYKEACAKLYLLWKKDSVLICESDEEKNIQGKILDEIKRNQLRQVQATLIGRLKTDSIDHK